MNIKYITLNIWHGGKLTDNILTFIEKEDPDIIGLQEVYERKSNPVFERVHYTETILKKLNYPYNAFSPAFFDKRQDTQNDMGNLILSKYPISSNETIYFDIPYSTFDASTRTDFENIPAILQHGEIMIKEKKIHIFNIHGIWGHHGNDTPRRLHMSEIIISHIKSKENVILAGDFNVQPHTKTIDAIETILQNIFKDELHTTFNMKHKEKTGYASAVVDMLFVSHDMKVISHYQPDVDVSDHFPLVANIDL